MNYQQLALQATTDAAKLITSCHYQEAKSLLKTAIIYADTAAKDSDKFEGVEAEVLAGLVGLKAGREAVADSLRKARRELVRPGFGELFKYVLADIGVQK